MYDVIRKRALPIYYNITWGAVSISDIFAILQPWNENVRLKSFYSFKKSNRSPKGKSHEKCPLFWSPSMMHLEQLCGHRAQSHKLSGLYIMWWHNSCPKSRLFWLGFLSTSHTKPFVFWGSGRDKPRRHLTKWCKCTIVNNDTRHYTSVGLISVKYTSVALYFEKYTSVAFMLSLRAIWPSGTNVFSSGKVQVQTVQV